MILPAVLQQQQEAKRPSTDFRAPVKALRKRKQSDFVQNLLESSIKAQSQRQINRSEAKRLPTDAPE